MQKLFMAAFKYHIEQGKRGAQTRIAEALGITPKYINDLVKDRRSPSQDLQEKITAYYGIKYEDFIAFGRHILEGKDPDSFHDEPPAPSPSTHISPPTKKPELVSNELEMVKFIMAQIGPSLSTMTGEIKRKTALFLLDICPPWTHEDTVRGSGFELHSEEMLQLIRRLAWQDEKIKGSLGTLGFGTAKTDRDYLNWQITNKDLYEICQEEARQVKAALRDYEKEMKQE